MGAAPTDTPHGVPHVLGSLEQVQQHLGTVASTCTSPRLVVLDDVWELEVVEALLPLGLMGLVTACDRSVLGVPAGCVEVGDMTEEEALELLLKTSRIVGQPGDAMRTQMTKVVALCGRLPLVLAIAGSMPVVKGKGLTAGAWAELIEDFGDVAEKMRARGEHPTSIKIVLEISLDALSRRRQQEFLKMAVLAAGAVAPVEMLRNLWAIEDTEGTREEADGLVRTCLLQHVDGVGFHDLVLEFLQDNIKADVVHKATALQAAYLRRLDVLEGYGDPKHGAGNQGLFVLDCFWRSVEKLSGDPGLEVASYRASLGELEPLIYCDATSLPWFLPSFLQSFLPFSPNIRHTAADVAAPYSSVARLFELQGKFSEAEPLCTAAQKIFEKSLGRGHPDVPTIFNNRTRLLQSQDKYDEAEPLYVRAIAIGEKAMGPEHSDLAAFFNNRTGLLETQGKYAGAEALYERSQAIREMLDPEHPDVAQSLSNRALLMGKQGKYVEAGPLYRRSQAIREKLLGPEHPNVAQSLNNRAVLLQCQV